MPWWTDEEWTQLHAADGCGMCGDAHLESNPHSILIASTETTHLRLARNQAHPGYCLVILREHVTDLSLLEPTQLAAFWRDVQRAGRAIGAALDPRKIDYLVMGHRMPHLHCHLLPQHSSDDPTRNVDISDGPVLCEDAVLAERARAIRQARMAT
ncbi:HIT family protein [Microbacterium sp. M28]|uniref:HIT family protein n=1 Tax=Microbacterium sp. M28 TaxID=2962064 RepID=UPI0021F47D0F|nr:HIT family protein [Microbacterium sp. M28]UYO98266.1 HIT family protein [Microbacterium sp. M28]